MAPPSSQYRVKISVDMGNVEDLKKVQQELTKIIKLSDRINKNAGKGFDQITKSTRKTQIEMRKFGRGLSNASYQVQDFIVQVSGGVDPLRSFSQQAPQLLINMGALGAVIGVVAAGLPILIQQFMDAEESSVELDESISNLAASISTFNKSGSEFDLLLVSINKSIGEQGLVAEIRKLNKEIEASKFESYVALMKSLADEAPDASSGLRQVAEAARDNETIIERSIRLFAEWVDGAVEAAEAQGRVNAEIENSQNLFDLNAQDAAKVAGILRTYSEAGKEYEDTIAAIRDLEDALAVASKTADNNAEGLLRTIEQLRAALKTLQGTEKLDFIKPQGREVKAKKFKEPTLNRVVAQDPYNATFKQAEANLKLAESYRMLYDPLAAYEAELEKIISVQNLMSPETTAKAVEAAADAYEKATEQITFAQQAAEVFQQSFDTAFQGVAMGTQDVSDAFRNMAKVIIAQLLKIAAYKTIAGFGFGGEFGGQVAWGAAQGGVVSGGNKLQAFASGGIVNGPTAFGMSRGRTGLMGEAGPEMIAPVKRMPNGDMGVGASPVNVTVNNNAAGVETIARQDSNGGLTIDVVLKQAAQAIQSGGNVFADSLEKSYSLNRGRSTY